MKIATFNVNGIGARLDGLLTWLEESAPDVVCLQELKIPDERFPIDAIRETGFDGVWHGQKSWNGVAILAKDAPVREIRRGLPGDPDDSHSRYIEASVKGIHIASLYLPNGNPWPGPKFDYKLAWFERLDAHGRSLLKASKPVVLAGDFNVIPTDADAANPKRWVRDALYQPPSKAAFARMTEQGWTDAVRTLHPGKGPYTYWDYFRNSFARDDGIRIDHLLLNSKASSLLVGAGVDRAVRGGVRPSDHAPVWIELDENL